MAENDDQQSETEQENAPSGFFDQRPLEDAELSIENIQSKKSRIQALKSKQQRQIVVRKQFVYMLLLSIAATAYVVYQANPFEDKESIVALEEELRQLEQENEEKTANETTDTEGAETENTIDSPADTAEAPDAVEPIAPVPEEKIADDSQVGSTAVVKAKKKRRRKPRVLSKPFVDPEKEKKQKLNARRRAINKKIRFCELSARKKDPTFGGSWSISFKILSSGSPSQLTVRAKSRVDKNYERCVMNRIKQMTLEPIPNENNVSHNVVVN